ncbi:hypothetical protein M404DRAFT_993900 [Pisolithus tinctorius Marx 270]|uniref:Uncharacterized protein n=1 Tax=Pisolithus tinctorius Marx 270 TaxID=870435 RepID=A0A0C3KTS0_PISTI|nr:hypothetical protein M404DRAFT_993900 [Pisolithus tinctorius Marx 270]
MADGDIPYSRDGRTGASASQDHGVDSSDVIDASAITLVDGRDRPRHLGNRGCRTAVKFSLINQQTPAGTS